MENLFVERIKKLIEESGITQRDLAQDIGVTESTISKYLSLLLTAPHVPILII